MRHHGPVPLLVPAQPLSPLLLQQRAEDLQEVFNEALNVVTAATGQQGMSSANADDPQSLPASPAPPRAPRKASGQLEGRGFFLVSLPAQRWRQERG